MRLILSDNDSVIMIHCQCHINWHQSAKCLLLSRELNLTPPLHGRNVRIENTNFTFSCAMYSIQSIISQSSIIDISYQLFNMLDKKCHWCIVQQLYSQALRYLKGATANFHLTSQCRVTTVVTVSRICALL